jgi:hypothetical protein|tara:strand:+ start:740 stop:1012 length:273 start_codon:yes stop_codon:yes gene_type:complete
MSDKEPEKRPSGTTITGVQLLVGMIFIPVVMVWLALGARIIWSATGNPETLDQIEGLLTALAVLSLPVSMGLQKLFEAFGNEIESRRRDD